MPKDSYQCVASAVRRAADCSAWLADAAELIPFNSEKSKMLRGCVHKVADLQLQLALLLKQVGEEK